MNNPKGIKTCVKWVMKRKLLYQFNFTQQMEEEEEMGLETREAWQDNASEISLEMQEEQLYNLAEQDTLGSSESEGEGEGEGEGEA